VPLKLDPGAQAAIDLAKRTVPDGEAIGAGLLLAALYHAGELEERHASLARFLTAPAPIRPAVSARVPLAADVQPLLQGFADADHEVSALELFDALLASDAGRAALRGRGASDEDLAVAVQSARELSAASAAWRASPERRQALDALRSYGRPLTDGEPPPGAVVEREDTLRALVRTLCKMKRRNAIVVGPAGSGKSAIVYELARRMSRRDPSLPPRLRDMDIFELSPTFLRSGTSMVGEYEKRVKELLEVLQTHPRIILFIDEIHSMFSSGVHGQGPFSDANEGFKSALGRGEITCLGCTTPGEFRHSIEPDKALERRFGIIRLEPPSREATLAILKARRARMEEYFAPLRIPEAMLERAVALTEEYIPGRYQPDKSIQLLDEACAYCATADPPAAVVTEAMLHLALEDVTGHGILQRGSLSESDVFERLRAKILGQDEVLRQIARAFVAGFGDWSRRTGPRGVFLFGGPTGTGKTETALVLAGILGGDRESLIRVDCNSLQGSGPDSGPAIGRLLGPPPGYVGYARGQGGILSRIRDVPECVVLFDEFEKAGPGVGRLLLQIIDEGKIEDVDGNLLDFRRAFVIFTTNAGCHLAAPTLGFTSLGEAVEDAATDLDAIRHELGEIGLGDEFFARVTHTMMFRPLERATIRTVLERRLDSLRRTSSVKGLELSWEPELLDHLSAAWQPRYGVRFAAAVLRNRIGEQLDIAEAQGELKGVTRIRLELLGGAAEAAQAAGPADAPAIGRAERRREGDSLVIAVS
jgi:ATP-dependent Clp protease ATP-binding subunit ClpA